jgi:hypothetical protein
MRSPWTDPLPTRTSNPERGDAVTDETQDSCCFPSDTTHAEEVRDAQAARDRVGERCRSTTAPARDAAADLQLLRGLVAAYGADGVRRMIDSLK